MDAYQRIKVLGRGSFGQAILVKERRGNQLRVVKEVDLSRIPQKARNDAQTEVTVLRSLRHPNIVAYYDGFEEGCKLCIVMEFADGGDLTDVIKRRREEGSRFSEDEALGMFAQCCLALQHVHNKHILHRDLKCQNIFMTKSGVVKLGDFGIAKVLDETYAEAITFIGTPVYLAPEVCDNRPYGKKADIWSLGVVLYEILQLVPPFKADNIGALMLQIMQGEPAPLSAEHYSSALRAIVASMLRKRPEQRPSAEELLSDPLVAPAAGGGGHGPGPARAAAGSAKAEKLAPAAAAQVACPEVDADALDRLLDPTDATCIPGRSPAMPAPRSRPEAEAPGSRQRALRVGRGGIPP